MKKRRPRHWRVAMVHTRSPWSPFSALEFPVMLQVHVPGLGGPHLVDTRAMIDLEASCCFMHPHFVQEQQLPMVHKKRPLHLWTVDNSKIQLGLIVDEVYLQVVLGEHVEAMVFDVVDLGGDNLILGVNWLC